MARRSTTKQFPCPACGATAASVWDSRIRPTGRTRRRKCGACGANYQTFEAVIGDSVELDELALTG
jgi:transcriptional regulator NrdR family protein